MKNLPLVQQLTERSEYLFSLKTTWNALWNDISELCLPRRGSMSNDRFVSPGRDLQSRIFDGTAPWALEQLASGLHSYLTSSSKRWFRAALPEPAASQFANNYNVKQWLQIVTDIMYAQFNSSKTNFATMAHELYLDMGAFGTGVMYVEETQEKDVILRFNTYHLADCAFAENQYGRVDTVVRKFKLAGRSAINVWPQLAGTAVGKQIEFEPMKDIEFLHYVCPRKEFDTSRKDSKNMPWASYYIHAPEKLILSESGFHEFPYMVPRWTKLTGEVYGRSPAMTVLPDIRLVNSMARTLLVGAQKTVDPPLVLPDEGFMIPIRTAPGSLIFKNSSIASDQNTIQPLPVAGGPALNVGNTMLESRQQHIIRGFYIDWMQLQQGPQMTATEVVQRTEEKMRLMAPAIARQQSEYQDPMIDRVFAICLRAGLFPPPPEEIRGMNLKIEYVSDVAKAQKMVQAQSFTDMLQSLAQVAQVKPEIMDKFNGDGIVDFFADIYDISAQVLRPQEEVDQQRQAQAEMMQQQMQQQQDIAQAEALQKGGAGMASMAKGMEGL